MDAKIFRINYKSDFILTLESDAGWMTPFCIKFWTGAPSQAYYVGWDGTTYDHCSFDPSEPTKLQVQFDDHHLPIGDLKFQVAYHFTVADFPNDTEDEVINPANITTEIDGETYQVMLDFTGETAPEIEFSLPAYANEAQRIANEQQRIAAETQRIANEETRIANEQTRINQEQTRQQNEQQRINQEQARVNDYAILKADAVAATDAANDAATLAQQKAEYAQQQGVYAKEQGDYAKNQGDYAKEQGDTALADHQRAETDHGIAVDDHTQAGNDHTRAEADHGIAVDDHTHAGNDHTRAESDHATAAADHTQAGQDHTTAASDHSRAESDHTTAAADHTQAGQDHTTAANDHGIAAEDHTQAGNDHTRAESDHGIAADDHTQAGNDHTRAESDHTRAESDHAAVEVYVDSLGAFDISAYHATGGVTAEYADLTAALGTNGANIPDALRKGGMSVKFVHSSDNKYVQYRLTADEWSTTVSDWQGVDKELVAGSHNLAESGVVYEENSKLSQKVDGGETTFNYEISAGNVAQGVIKYPSETGTYIVKCYSTSALTLSFRETAEGTSYYAHTVQPNETYEFEIEGTFNWLRYYNVASGSFSISRKENNKSEIIKIKQDIAEINNTDSPSEDSNKFVKSGDIYNYTKKVVNDSVENALILEKNGIVSGVDTVNAARFRTYGYIKAPFSITLVSGYVIVQQFKYKIVKGSIVYDSLVQVNADTLTVDNEDEYLYKLSFKRTDNANITDSDLTSAVSAFNAYNYIDAYVRSKANNINMLDGIAETYTDIPFIPISGSYYNASGEIVLEQNYTRFVIPLNNIKKLRFLVTASSKANFGFVVNGTFTALSYSIGEKIGTSYTYRVTLDVPFGATELRISTADGLLILPQKVEAIETVNDLFADVKLPLSGFTVEDNIEIGNYGYLLEDGTLNSNATYKHGSVDLTKAVYKKLCITYAYVGSTVATYGFIVDGVWQGVRIDIPSPYTEVRTAVIDVPDRAAEFRCSWNMNVLSADQLVVYAYGVNAIDRIRRIIENDETIVHNKLQIDPTFDLSCVPEMTGTTENLVLSTTLETFYSWYDALVSAYPNYITKVDCDAHAQSELGITKPSYLDGLPIYMYKLKPAIGLPYSTGTTEYITRRPKVLLTSMHPQERFGDFALYNFVKMLCENWSDDMNIGVLRSFVDFYILPFAWPWNFVNNSRVNYNGVNANRQFPTIGWHIEGEPGNDNYSGQEPLSEYEAKVVALYVREIQPDVVIDIHTSDQDESGLMGMVECRSDNDLIMNLVGAICRTTSNAAIADNPNYPQNDPDHTIYRMYPSLNGGHVGIFFVYCYEQGIKYSILTEESARSKWNNGVFDINGPVIEKYTNGLLRQQVQYLFNCVLRMVKSFVDNN